MFECVNEAHDIRIIAADGGGHFELNHSALIRLGLTVSNVPSSRARSSRKIAEILAESRVARLCRKNLLLKECGACTLNLRQISANFLAARNVRGQKRALLPQCVQF